MALLFIFLQFCACIGLIFFAGKRVAESADIIAEKTGLGGLWIGLILVSITTSLPEIFTGVGSIFIQNAPDLSVGNLFGANSYNLLNIALLDFLYKKGPLYSSLSSGQLLTACLSVIPMFIAAIGIVFARTAGDPVILGVSAFSWAILGAYMLCSWQVFRFETKDPQLEQEMIAEEATFKYADRSFRKAVITFALGGVMVIAAGLWLSYIGESFSVLLGLGKSFVGTLILGFATTLPEITVSAAAIALGAEEIAVANMLGSNLFNMSIIFINDLLYRKGSVLAQASTGNALTALVNGLMTCMLILALVYRPRKKKAFGLSGYSIVIVVIFVIGMLLNFLMAKG